MALIILLVLLVVLIVMYYLGYFTYTASDLPPFSDLSYAIDPSVLKEAKRDYNKLINTVFNVLNNQTQLLNNSVFDSVAGPPPLISAIEEELQPLYARFAEKYTPEIRGKLIKYFVCKHIKVLLDNYYLGPHIYIAVPDIPMFNIKAFPFTYDAKRRPGTKPAKGSSIAPFKYFAKNIPDNIRPKVAALYDDILKRYMRAFNKAVVKLPELNMQTIMTININSTLQRYSKMIARDLETIQKLFGANVSRTVQAILTHNLLPLLNKYYKGPAINLAIPLTVPSNPHIVLVNFPNTSSSNIIQVEPGCPPNQVLQTTVLDKEKGIIVNECILPTNRDLTKISTVPLECPAGQALQTTLIDVKKNVKSYECVAATSRKMSPPSMSQMSPPNMSQMFGGSQFMPSPPTMSFPNNTPATPAMQMTPRTFSQKTMTTIPQPATAMPMPKPAVISSPPMAMPKPVAISTPIPPKAMAKPLVSMPMSSPAKPLTTTFSSPSTSSASSSSVSSSVTTK